MTFHPAEQRKCAKIYGICKSGRSGGRHYGGGWLSRSEHKSAKVPASRSGAADQHKPNNAAKKVRLDAAWFVAKRPDGKTNADHIQERWLAWRSQ
jgi:hypothetical protein